MRAPPGARAPADPCLTHLGAKLLGDEIKHALATFNGSDAGSSAMLSPECRAAITDYYDAIHDAGRVFYKQMKTRIGSFNSALQAVHQGTLNLQLRAHIHS